MTLILLQMPAACRTQLVLLAGCARRQLHAGMVGRPPRALMLSPDAAYVHAPLLKGKV